MANKVKGNKTKEHILYHAKREFYEKGYNDAWVKTIAKNAGVRLGNLNYYFSKKDDIVEAIYDQLVLNIYKFTEARCECDELQKFCHFTAIIYKIILSDERNKRFYSEVIINKSNYRILHELMRGYYHKMVDSIGLNLSDIEFDVFVLCDFGARREIFLSYFSNTLYVSFEELIYYIINHTYKYLGIEACVIEKYLSSSFTFINENDYSELKLFI